jgi:RimJ/RimL family protein N-acetyltransferase
VTTIRHALPEEAEALAALHVRTWQEAYAGLMPDDYLRSLTPSERLPMWERILGSERVAVFVVELDGELIGFSCGGTSNDEDAEPTTGEMWSIYLLREFWGKAIGKELHDTLLAHFRGWGFQKATLWVLESNDRTRRWYERQGWEHDGSQKTAELWGTTISEVRYWKQLVSGS